jgi:two-component system, sensor histidine kinase and response regulator
VTDHGRKNYSVSVKEHFDEAAYLSAVRSGDFSRLLAPQRVLLDQLRANPALRAGDPREAIAQLTEAAARMLDVARVGLWRFDKTHKQLVCLDLFDRDQGMHERDAALPNRAAPRYFAAIETGKIIAAEDAFADPRTSELGRNYLSVHHVGALLDTPVILDGELAGVLCHEHVGGARRWRAWERTVAASLSDCAGLVLGDVD